MLCRACQSGSQKHYPSEINIHFPGLKGLDQETIWVFQQLLICLKCGFTEFSVPEKELRRRADGAAGPNTQG